MPPRKHIGYSFCLFGLVAAVVLALGGMASAQSKDCEAPADWFTGGIPDPKVLAEDADFFDNLCAFHTWSWNAFLWLMQEQGAAPRFESFPTLEQVIAGSFDPAAPAPEMATLRLRVAKNDHPIDSVAQAATPGILVDQNGRAVYYSQYVNPQMYDQIIKDNWNTAAGLEAESPDAEFDNGNIELKAAWKIVGPNETADYAYTRKALLPPVVNETVNGVTVIRVPESLEEDDYMTETVALVGFHVVGWVAGHSEAIWATFSPPGIAPVVPDGQTSGPVSLAKTPFYAANTFLSDCNQTAVPIQVLHQDSQLFRVKTEACQIYAGGTLPTASAPNDNRATIDRLNASVTAQLPAGTLAGKYMEIGAVWSVADKPGVSKVNSTFQDALIGSDVLSNPVIETFTQTMIGQDNCFGCHNSIQYQPSDPSIPALQASMLNLSHIILEAYIRDPKFAN